MLNIKNILLRIFALFSVTGLKLIGAGSLTGVHPLFAAAMGGALAVSDVIEDLAKSFLDDGKLTKDEVNGAFKKAVSKMKKEDK